MRVGEPECQASISGADTAVSFATAPYLALPGCHSRYSDSLV